MNKLILLYALLLAQLQADDFTRFLSKALQNNANLQAAKVQIDQSVLKSKKTYRYENPNIEGSVAKYDDESGYSIALSQQLQLPDTRSDLKKLANLHTQKAHALYRVQKAKLIRTLSLDYLNYRQKSALAALAQKENRVAEKIYTISKSRFAAGTIPRSKLMQAKLDWKQSIIRQKKLALVQEQSYYRLLLQSGITETITLGTRHPFMLRKSESKNPILILRTLEEQITMMRARTTTKTVDTIQLQAGYEKEPEQDIARIGISMPLALFHQKNEEKKIAALSIAQERFSLEKYRRTLALQKEQLRKERKRLLSIIEENSKLLLEQQKMLHMFEEGYKIANVNLLELQNIKSRLIQTHKAQITLQKALDTNTITQNYLNGVYND